MAQVADEYRRRGYEVMLEPQGPVLPTPVQRLSPDLIAVRGDDRVAVIVKRRRGPSIPHLSPMSARCNAKGGGRSCSSRTSRALRSLHRARLSREHVKPLSSRKLDML